MTTKREWLIEKGLAKPGRGRFSREAVDAIAKAEEEGMQFSDGGSTRKVHTAQGYVTITENPEQGFPPHQTPRYTGQWKTASGVLVSGNEVCRTCNYSLDYHICGTPVSIFPDSSIGPVIHYASTE